jgi:pilus assembly protein CpaF
MMTSGSDEGWFLEYEERRIDLREGEVTLGRSRGCGVVLRDPSVSRGHALLSVRQGRVTLQDLRSSNGTYVNGKRLEKETVVEDGDRLVIGETELFLRRVRAGESGSDGPGGRRIETGEVSLFCPACGLPIHGAAGGRCPGCGAELIGGRLPRISEASGLGEVLPVGEALGTASDSWDRTGFRQRAARAAAGSRGIAAPVGLPKLPPEPAFPPEPAMPAAPTAPAIPSTPATSATSIADAAPAPGTAELADPASTAETRPRDASGGIQLSPPTAPAVPRAPGSPPATEASAGLWSRLSGYFKGRKSS